jgi:hypothetical protein
MDAKSKSPRYPSISLGEALDKIKLVYKKEHRHKADKEVIVKDIGYAGLNGASLGMLASLKQYNLLESAGDGFKVSDDAVTLIELPLDDAKREEALMRVAYAPKVFTELDDEFGDKLPSDENLRLFLVNKGFNSKAANLVIRMYRDTISLVKEERQGYNAGMTTQTRNDTPPDRLHPGQPSQESGLYSRRAGLGQSNVPSPAREGLNFQVTDDSINVSFNGRVTQEIIRKLIKHLEINVEDYPTREQLEKERQDNLLRAVTTNPDTGKPYTEGKSKVEIDNLFNSINEAGKQRGE